MTIQNIVPVLPTADLASAVTLWTGLLGVPPTFVDGDRWAQFDVAGKRLALAGTDRMSDAAGIMIRVDDLDAALAAARAAGLATGVIEQGGHERRCLIEAEGAPVVLYATL